MPSLLDALSVRQGPALVSEADGLSLTFDDLRRRVADRARRLDGVQPGDLVALAARSGVAFIEQFLAVRTRGAAALAIDARHAAADAATRLAARWLVDDDGVRELSGGAVRVPEGTALVKMTSGSTMSPRGACFTEEALLAGIANIAEAMALTSADVVLMTVPLSHSYGFDNGVLSLLCVGTPLVLQPDITPAALRASMVRHGVTFFPAVPALLRALAGAGGGRVPSLRSVVCASAPLARDVAAAFAAAYGVAPRQFYGATECGGIAFESRPDDTAGEGTVGFPLPRVRVELVDGCVRVHSSAVRTAAWPPATAPAWVDTGDRAEWTPEGRLRLLGRREQVANVAGFKVDLAAIEAVLRALPGVVDAAAVAVEDPARGQRVVVCVEAPGHTPQSVRALLNGGLGRAEVPREIRIVARLPRTARGKVDQAALEELARV